jgi:tellurium resistance protein TerZ
MARYSGINNTNTNIDIKLDSINLSKDMKLTIEKSDNITNVTVGLGWDPVVKNKEIDLDSFVFTLDKNDNLIDIVYYGYKHAEGITHNGDNLTGEGDGDDETINIDLSKLNSQVTRLIIGVNSYSGQKFNEIKNAFVRLIDDNHEFCRYDISNEMGNGLTMVMCELIKINDEWTFKAIGKLEKYNRIIEFSQSFKKVEKIDKPNNEKKGFFAKLFNK